MSESAGYPWRRPLGARPVGREQVEFRVWAPAPREVSLRVGGREHALAGEGLGMFAARVPAAAGDDYVFLLDGAELPDPCSRLQPRGLRGPSRVVDPGAFAWTDGDWGGVGLGDLVLYELHVGTFTEQGTFDAVIPHLRALRELGVTAIELLPVADFPGRRGWGYDGVYLWAAHEAYGGPAGLQRLVDAAHGEGLGVLLDVVYNHVGASGQKALEAFGPYFTDRYSTFWGAALNYDDAGCDAVREWVLQGAEWWVGDMHLDGLRLDAVHAIYDFSARPLLRELGERVRAARPGALVIAESGLNDPMVIRPAEVGGLGLDAQWADDFHHALRALLTGEQDGYYVDFGAVGQLAKAFRRPFVLDGGWSRFRGRRHGAPAPDRPPEQFVVYSQNHDQVGNRARGDRMPAAARPLAAFCTLLSPYTPMLFMGEEHGERAPFQFFTDHIDDEIAQATREGRREEFAAFASFDRELPDPQSPDTFARSRLTREADPALVDLYRRLLALRPTLARDEAHTRHDEEARWLVVHRGAHELACNFAAHTAAIPVRGGQVVLATHHAELRDGHVVLPQRAGALVA